MLDKDDPWLERVSDRDVVDPLSDVARKERTALMVCNLFLFAVVQMGIVPKKLSIAGIESVDFEPKAVVLLAWILVLYFLFSFGMTVGAELRAWRSRLESLRERRQLRANWYLEKRLAAGDPPENMLDDAALMASRRTNMIISHNRAQQLDWIAYQKMYRLRMFLDGAMPLLLTLFNMVAALLRSAV